MKLRALAQKDAPLMLEWMHNPDVVEHLSSAFATKTLEDCQRFIAASLQDTENRNLAVADDTDTYMGTVSLKHIDLQNREAEFAISMRSCAMGKGFSKFAMAEIIRWGFEELGLRRIYWCVSPKNARAVRFYDKSGYRRVNPDALPAQQWYTPEQIGEYLWYAEDKNG